MPAPRDHRLCLTDMTTGLLLHQPYTASVAKLTWLGDCAEAMAEKEKPLLAKRGVYSRVLQQIVATALAVQVCGRVGVTRTAGRVVRPARPHRVQQHCDAIACIPCLADVCWCHEMSFRRHHRR